MQGPNGTSLDERRKNRVGRDQCEGCPGKGLGIAIFLSVFFWIVFFAWL